MATEPTSRLSQITTVISDVDSVLTSGKVTYPSLERQFSVRDGHGVQLLKEKGIRVIFMSGENDSSIKTRAKKLGVEFYHAESKYISAKYILGLSLNRTAFIGDDLLDLELLKAVHIAACPADADPAVISVIRERSDNDHWNTGYLCSRKGGEHCFREFVNWLLEE